MSKWCVLVLAGALLALPGFAQQKIGGSEDGTAANTETAAKSPDAAEAVNVAPARNFFAMPRCSASNTLSRSRATTVSG